TPGVGTTYAGGNTINFSGTGTDPEDGTEPASRFTWWVNFHHDTHFHPFLPPTSGISSGAFVIPTIGETSPNAGCRVHRKVVASGGPTHEPFRNALRRASTMCLRTDTAGLQLTLDGQTFTSPQDVIGVEGI